MPVRDQRGAPFSRVADGDGAGGARIDIGAYERQTLPGLTLVVDILADESDGNYSVGDLSLREAVELSNGSIGFDTITFAAALTSGGPASIVLTLDELAIRDSLTIDGPGANLLSIDGNSRSRIFNIDDASSSTTVAVEIARLTLTNADPPIDNFSSEDVRGGAIFNVESLTVSQCTIASNVLHESIIGNDTLGAAIYTAGNTTITESTISNNVAFDGDGRAIHVDGGTLTILSSTISSNFGGGITFASSGSLVVRYSTVTANQIFGTPINNGAGINISSSSPMAMIDHTIVTGNIRFAFGDEFRDNVVGPASLNFSHVNYGDAFLGPLADNGGPTKTHALLAGSPAVNAGDPAGVGSVPLFDQRGSPFGRVLGGRIDIGAIESRVFQADFDNDLDVDGFDFLTWQRWLGLTGLEAEASKGNADQDLDVDGADLAIWRSQFGLPSSVAAVSPAAVPVVAPASAADAVFAAGDFTGLVPSSPSYAPAKRRALRR